MMDPGTPEAQPVLIRCTVCDHIVDKATTYLDRCQPCAKAADILGRGFRRPPPDTKPRRKRDPEKAKRKRKAQRKARRRR